MSSVYSFTLCFFVAVLNPVSLALGAARSSGAAGFSLPLVPHYRTAAGVLEELLPEGDAEGGVNITSIRPKMIPYSGPLYSVRVGVGSGATQHFYKLALDLARPLTPPTPCIRQLSDRGLAGSRFSYCLVGKQHEHLHRRGFLRFGADIPDQSHARSTALLHWDLAKGRGMYYVNLVGVSLGGRRLTAITPATFKFDPHSLRGGCTLDVGTAYTLMAPPAYHVLAAEVVKHMQRHGVHHAILPPAQKLCFHGTWDSIRVHFPSVTLHFYPESASLFIKPELLFVETMHQHTHYACFAIAAYAERTVIGAGQMLDTRFTFDLQHNRLFFAPEDCHLDTSTVN
uniref:Aspartic proteinase nepenthesin-2 n=1 Tax=Aegilops tauschii TaxID=37682 RepID=M8BTT5_AEGTA